MTTQEKIEVMKAYAEGKRIQWSPKNYPDWNDCAGCPDWNWGVTDYRIKPEPTYRPYKDTEEMIEDFKKRFNAKVPPYAMPRIWIKRNDGSDLVKLITGFRDKFVEIIISVWDMKSLLERWTYLDGSPCGIKEE